jgi:hypothetical protein
MGTITDLVILFTIGPFYLGKNAAPVIDQDDRYWIREVFYRFGDGSIFGHFVGFH